ncbi:MAG: 3-oxoacyl-ACP reductase [Nitrospinae bacterium CG11_big_fil_rev_8_21_14_0_20_56_8]|nr:MAG: 3-oxoacyl-ACP reductase [Nitrospinae bacterium CG11_big_fil_rev_8_21_14_0_20_56_8]
MEFNLQGRKVVVTGCGDGIGRALALAFAREGARIAGCARTETRLDSLNKEIEGKHHFFLPCDLTRKEDIEKFHKQVLQSFGGLDILVNNAGSILKLDSFFTLTDDDWQDSFNLNLLSAVRLSRLFIPALKHSSSPRIINISSISATRPDIQYPHYSAMKAGMSNFTVSLAQTLAQDKILVNSVSPGPVWTRSWEQEADQIARQSGKPRKEIIQEIQSATGGRVPLHRMGVPEDLTGLVLFLSSDLARWITAANFTVDGGWLRDPY